MSKHNKAPADPNVKIPDAVKRAAASAEAFYQPGNPEPADQPEPAPEPAPEPEPAPQQEPVTQLGNPTPEQPISEESWEQRYKAMKGRFEASERRIADLVSRLDAQQQVIDSLNTKLEAKAATPPASERKKLVTPEEEQDYGAEFLGVVAKKAREELDPEVAALREQVAMLQNQLADVGNYVATSTRAQMQAHLDSQVPEWRSLNTNPDFLAWLALPDPLSGDIRQKMLTAAYERNEALRVAAFFKGFLAEEAALNPATARQPAPVTAPKVDLASFAAPGRAKSAAAPSSPEKPIISRADITKFYADVAAGKYEGRDSERQAFEKQIFAASRDNRIQ